MASPWSAPTWMKTNGKWRDGSLRPEYYAAYAQYFVKYVLEMRKLGVAIDAITVQNEPLNFKNTPSMLFSPQQQADFIKSHLGPAFAAAGLATKIVVFDHNLDRPDYPLAILADPAAAKYIDGTAFHHYGGDMQTLSTVHLARPDKNLYFTEQMVIEEPESNTIDIATEVQRLIVSAMRNWSRNVLLWNLAADAQLKPHTDDGGCTMCQGALTIERDEVTRNIAYYTLAHASKFVPSGSTRIYSTDASDMAVLSVHRPGSARGAPRDTGAAQRSAAQRRVQDARSQDRPGGGQRFLGHDRRQGAVPGPLGQPAARPRRRRDVPVG